MFLLIDTSEHDKIHLALFDKKQIEHKYYSGRNREILSCIDKLFKSQKSPANGIPSSQRDIKSKVSRERDPVFAAGHKVVEGIMVVVKTGSFTSTRVACVVANTFAYVLQIPLLAVSKKQAENPQKLIPKLLKQKKGHYLSATYSGEPNIGGKK